MTPAPPRPRPSLLASLLAANLRERGTLIAERERLKARAAHLDDPVVVARMTKAEQKRARRAQRNLAIAAAGGAELAD
jgi:hypothetical protein